MSLLSMTDPRNTSKADTEYTPELDGHEPLHDESEGGEYMDDALRMHEQPLTITESEEADG